MLLLRNTIFDQADSQRSKPSLPLSIFRDFFRITFLFIVCSGFWLGQDKLLAQQSLDNDSPKTDPNPLTTIRDTDFSPTKSQTQDFLNQIRTGSSTAPFGKSSPADNTEKQKSRIVLPTSREKNANAFATPIDKALDHESQITTGKSSADATLQKASTPKKEINDPGPQSYLASENDRLPKNKTVPDTSEPVRNGINATDQASLPQETGKQIETSHLQSSAWSFQRLTDRKNLPSTVQMIISVAAISLVPAILLMTTCFIRIVVVLGILRQAIGLQQLPPTQVTTALALMMTFLIMAPTWKEVKENAIDPYSSEESEMTWDEAWRAGITPVKKFMWSQIRRAENENDFWVFYDYLPEKEKSKEPESFVEVPLKVLLPAFMISELKVAFLIGIQVLLPFLILDIVVASLCNTMGLIMLPPAVVSLPFKLLLFVMVDGWNLVVAMLLSSFSVL